MSGRIPSVLLVALSAGVGIGMAWLGFTTIWLIPIALLGLSALVAWALFRAGKARTKTDPQSAVRLMSVRLALGLLLAGGASALIIAISVWLGAPEKASAQTKELLTASVAALTALITAIFIKDAETADEAWVAKPVADAFQEAFKGEFDGGSRGQLAVFGGNFEGHDGWGYEARRARARAIAEAIGT